MFRDYFSSNGEKWELFLYLGFKISVNFLHTISFFQKYMVGKYQSTNIIGKQDNTDPPRKVKQQKNKTADN